MPHPNKRTYTKDFIDTVLLVYRESPIDDYEQKIGEITRSYGISRQLLERWIRNSEQLVAPKLPANMSKRLEYLIDKLTTQIADDLDNTNATLRDKVISLGILMDKKRLIDGESTANSAQHIVYERRGIDTLSLPTAPGAIAGDSGTVEIQYPQLREAVGQDSPGG